MVEFWKIWKIKSELNWCPRPKSAIPSSTDNEAFDDWSKCLDGPGDFASQICSTKKESNPYLVFEYSAPVTVSWVLLSIRTECNVSVVVTDVKPVKGRMAKGNIIDYTIHCYTSIVYTTLISQVSRARLTVTRMRRFFLGGWQLFETRDLNCYSILVITAA